MGEAPAKIIDLHMHGIAGFDTRTTDPAAMLRIAEIEGGAGVSEIMLSIYPAPLDVMRGQTAAVKAAMARQGAGQARIIGVHLEGPFLNPLMAGALDPGSFIPPGERVFRELTEGYEEVVRIVTIAPEMGGAVPLIRQMADAGIRVNMGHSNATYAEAEAGFRAGARGITHLFNAMRGFHHREPGIAGFGLLNKDVYVEIIGDLVHLHPSAVELIVRLKDAGKVVLVSDSIRDTDISGNTESHTKAHRGGDKEPTQAYTLARQGERRGANKDGAKKAARYKTSPVEKGILSGGSLTIADAGRRLIEAGFDADYVVRCMTTTPRSYLEG
ncbi:MAG: amidohydrolase family protein [Syntrophorhabdales bacterium]|jgi:N-acetylglucosamine-6-phosphate deacetylase